MGNKGIKPGTKIAPKLTRTKDAVIKSQIFYTNAFDKYYFSKVVGNNFEVIGGEILSDEEIEETILDSEEIKEYESELKSKLGREIKYYTNINVCCGYSIRTKGVRFLYIDDESQEWEDCTESDKLIDILKDKKYEGIECYREKFCRVILWEGKRYIIPIKEKWGSNCIEEAKQVVLENYLFEEDFYLVNPRKKQQYTIKLRHLDVMDSQDLVKTNDDTYRRRYETVANWKDNITWNNGILSEETRNLIKENNCVVLYEVYYFWRESEG